MDLSVIIVNYNVKYYLEQSLNSALKAIENIDAEIIVIDNASSDGSVEMLKENFKGINLIASTKNLGFSGANNLGIKQATGDFVLLLNPDTIVPEDCFEKCLHFAEETADFGALGVKMINGNGDFLPESKRGLPLPKVAFYKISGLAKLFPSSKKFGQYHLSYLPENDINTVDVLSGAFMFIKKEVLGKIGLLDETFFMYGEDIDLSYRIVKAGYKNYYFPKTQIIHYKGESTKKSSVNYVFVFYKAMAIFAKKHFAQKQAGWIAFFINIAIWLRAAAAIVRRFFLWFFLPVSEALLLYFSFILTKNLYAKHFRFPFGGHFPQYVIQWIFPIIVAIILLFSFIGGSYEKPYKLKKSIYAVITANILVLIVYAFLPESFRFSRILILTNFLVAITVIGCWRIILHLLRLFPLKWRKNKNTAIVAGEAEAGKLVKLLKSKNNIIYISPEKIIQNIENKSFFVGNIYQLKDLCDIYYVDEIIFSEQSLSFTEIINTISNIRKVTFFCNPINSEHIIGSEEIITKDYFYTQDLKRIFPKSKVLQKRLIDISLSCLLLITFPLHILFVKNKKQYLKNLIKILAGEKTFVGLSEINSHLPIKGNLNKGVLTTQNQIALSQLTFEQIEELNYDYIVNYAIVRDLAIVFRNFSFLGILN